MTHVDVADITDRDVKAAHEPPFCAARAASTLIN